MNRRYLTPFVSLALAAAAGQGQRGHGEQG